MPYSDRARFRHEEEGKPHGIVRIRTVRAGQHEVRVGYTRSGRAEVVSVLHPKGERRRRRSAAMIYRAHRHSRGEHPGRCSLACRRGAVSHPHRR